MHNSKSKSRLICGDRPRENRRTFSTRKRQHRSKNYKLLQFSIFVLVFRGITQKVSIIIKQSKNNTQSNILFFQSRLKRTIPQHKKCTEERIFRIFSKCFFPVNAKNAFRSVFEHLIASIFFFCVVSNQPNSRLFMRISYCDII